LEIEVKWKRPESYVMDSYLDKDLIARFPHKNHFYLRNSIKEFYYQDLQIQKEKQLKKLQNQINYEEEDSIDNYLEDNSQKRLYMKFFKHLEEKYDYKICPVFEKIDYENEITQRTESRSYNNEQVPHSKIKKLIPSNLYTRDKTCDFVKWISSIFQTINELEIYDAYNVIFKITNLINFN
jgi:hypothetical protein